MRLVFFGTPNFAVPTLEKLLHHPDFTVVGVVTQPDKRRGRGSEMIPSPVKQVALAHALPLWQPQRLKKDSEVLALLQQSHADAFVVVAYGQLLSAQILEMPKLGCINVHGSLLPKYRGAAPIQWSLYNGDRKTGITTMLMDQGMDTGAMLLKSDLNIGLLDNAQDIADKLSQQGADLLIQTLLERSRGDLTPIPQDNQTATYAPLIQKSDYEIDWNRSALDIHHQVRGFYPHCQTLWQMRSLKIRATIPLENLDDSELPAEFQSLILQAQPLLNIKGKPGEIVGILKNRGAIIQTGQGHLLLQELQLSGKRVQSGWDFVNGSHLTLGEQFAIIENFSP